MLIVELLDNKRSYTLKEIIQMLDEHGFSPDLYPTIFQTKVHCPEDGEAVYV